MFERGVHREVGVYNESNVQRSVGIRFDLIQYSAHWEYELTNKHRGAGIQRRRVYGLWSIDNHYIHFGTIKVLRIHTPTYLLPNCSMGCGCASYFFSYTLPNVPLMFTCDIRYIHFSYFSYKTLLVPYPTSNP